MSKKCRAFSESKLGLEAADNRKAFYAGWDAAIRQVKEPAQQEPAACKHSRYSVDAHEQTGHCYDCGAEGRMQFVVDDTPPAQQPAEQQEPVAWRTKNAAPPGGYVVFQQYPQAVANLGGEIEPLYTSPQPSKPWVGLDQHDIDVLFLNEDGVRFARYIEAKLKEKNGL